MPHPTRCPTLLCSLTVPCFCHADILNTMTSAAHAPNLALHHTCLQPHCKCANQPSRTAGLARPCKANPKWNEPTPTKYICVVKSGKRLGNQAADNPMHKHHAGVGRPHQLCTWCMSGSTESHGTLTWQEGHTLGTFWDSIQPHFKD